MKPGHVTAGEDGKRRTIEEELERIGGLGTQQASYKTLSFDAHFELHIEQGPILEKKKEKWVVETPMPVQARAIVERTSCYALQAIVRSDEVAQKCQGRATTGIVNAEPGYINTMEHSQIDTGHSSPC